MPRGSVKDAPKSKVSRVAAMLKAIHGSEDLQAAKEKAGLVVAKLREMKLKKAANRVAESIDETLTYMKYPREHWRKIRTNNLLDRVIKEVRRRTRVVGTFPDGHSALMLVAARLRHMAGTHWGLKRYMKMDMFGSRGRDGPFGPPPAQTRTCGTTASGSCLG